jgi:alpha-galactosidase
MYKLPAYKGTARILVATVMLATFFSCNNHTIAIKSGDLTIEVNKQMEVRVATAQVNTKPLMNNFTASEYLVAKDFEAKAFTIIAAEKPIAISDMHGKGTLTSIAGMFEKDGNSIKKKLHITVYDSFPGMAFIQVSYTNAGRKNIDLIKWVSNHYDIQSNGDTPAFWSFQGESSNKRADWLLPVDSSFSQRNYMGMTNTDYGGGIPITDLWRKDAGIAIGITELTPKLVSLPVYKNQYSSNAAIGIEYEYPGVKHFLPGDSIQTYQSFVGVHTKDHYNSFVAFSRFMQEGGIKFIKDEPTAFEPVWCAWGYMQKYTMAEIEGSLQKVKDLGIKWVDIDDGFQMAEGDWDIAPNRFPGGASAMRKLVDKIHSMGLKAKIWWAPLAVDPQSKFFAANLDIPARNKDNAPQFITGWESYYMSPVYDKTIAHSRAVIKMFLQDWDFDGLKMDGMHINCIGPDYNLEHKLKNPTEASEKLPSFFNMVYQTACSYKPHAVIQNCPCGCVLSFFNLAYMNQAVASDPVTSWQTRLKAKTIKALRPGIAYYGDHVEISDGGDDFASQLGVGAVLGTKFTWPKDNPFNTNGTMLLTPEKEQSWKKWMGLYNSLMLSKENYLGGLYDIGYDKPEIHVIQKSDTLYYAMYASDCDKDVALRGLPAQKQYRVVDYEHGVELDMVDASKPVLKCSFKGHLLIKVFPK